MAATPSGAIISALNDPARPQEDKDRDAQRHPADLMTFAGIKPGEKVADLLPGGGYFTRIFSRLVGPNGQVFAVSSTAGGKPLPEDPKYPNIKSMPQDFSQLKFPVPLDLAWTSDNYHDLKNKKVEGGGDLAAATNRAVFEALRPGGVYIVIDHAAASNAPEDVTSTLHRVNPSTVMKEVTAAGFKFESQSDVLANRADTHEAKVFDPSIRGKTDQFVFKFRKPGLPKP